MKTASQPMVLMLIVALILAGCAPAGLPSAAAEATSQPTLATGTPALPAPSPTSTQRTTPQRPRVGMPAYPFTLVDLDGNTVSLSDLQGKVVMLNFWASWCPPCQQEIPHMVRVYDELEDDDFVIVAVNLQEDADSVGRFVTQQAMRFPVLLDPTGSVANAYFVRAIPTSLFLDRDGVIQVVYEGTLTEEALRQAITRAQE
ncbi:MAG: TlpA family protein disulfide reductase [Anaerolineae bacterium]